MNKLLGIAVLAASLLAAQSAAAQYPSKPIRVVTPYPPGDPTDILARLLGQKMHEDWGQPVIVEAKPRAGGNVGTDYVAKAAPDGYTLLMGASGPLAINVTLGLMRIKTRAAKDVLGKPNIGQRRALRQPQRLVQPLQAVRVVVAPGYRYRAY
jgi:tripartite-type tricarboxylate transporter receptor subunit TctC